MYPEIIRFGRIAIYSYGMMMMMAFFFGILFAVHRGKKAGIASGTIWDLSMVILFTSLAGSRLTYVFTHLAEFKGNWFAIINPVQSDGRIGIAGMVLLGGVFLAIAASIYFIRKRKLNFWRLIDVMVPSLVLGMGLGRIGCFANGCCFGNPTKSFLGIIFPIGSPAGSYFPDTPLLPTQLFEVAWAFLLFLGLLWAERWKKFEGFTFALFLIGYGIFRIWVDTVRFYDAADILINSPGWRITFSQAFSAIMVVAGVWVWIARRRKKN